MCCCYGHVSVCCYGHVSVLLLWSCQCVFGHGHVNTQCLYPSPPTTNIHHHTTGEECYLAVDKGPVDPTHVLLLPIEHYPSLVSLPQQTFDEAQRYLQALQTAYAAQGKQMIAFERYASMKKMGGNHCHINVVGVDAAGAARARQVCVGGMIITINEALRCVFVAASQCSIRIGLYDPYNTTTQKTHCCSLLWPYNQYCHPTTSPQVFEAKGRDNGFSFQHLPPAAGPAMRAQLRAVVGDGEYLLALLPGDQGMLVHPILRGVRLSLQLGREALAELVGDPVKADWKACVVGVEEEKARTAAFKTFFAPYDIMPQ